VRKRVFILTTKGTGGVAIGGVDDAWGELPADRT
jgi:hypothetical protein